MAKERGFTKRPFNTRISEDILEMLKFALHFTNLSVREFTELALLSFIEKIDTSNGQYEDINFIDLAKLRKRRMLRQMQSLESTEILSEATFMLRVEENLLNMFLGGASHNEIKRLLKTKKLEATYYTDVKNLHSQLDYYINLPESAYKKTITMLREKLLDNEQYQNQCKSIVKTVGALEDGTKSKK